MGWDLSPAAGSLLASPLASYSGQDMLLTGCACAALHTPSSGLLAPRSGEFLD